MSTVSDIRKDLAETYFTLDENSNLNVVAAKANVAGKIFYSAVIEMQYADRQNKRPDIDVLNHMK